MKASYTLRIPEELQKKIKEEAKRSDMSINQYILYTLTKEIAYKEAAVALTDRIRKAPSREEALKLLDSLVPDIPPIGQDNILSAEGHV
jgi:HicB-like protein involved in pilus formation